MKLTRSQKTGKHTLSELRDGDLEALYHACVEAGEYKFSRLIRQHLTESISEEDLADTGITRDEFIANWLGLERS